MRIEEKVFSYIEKYGMIEAGSHVAAGVSGGADSVCLLFLLKAYQEQVPFSLHVVHVNHQIRGAEADRDAEFTKKLCEGLNLPLDTYDYCVPEIARREHKSLEEAGRDVRRSAFFRTVRRWEKPENVRIALAHQENDLAETVVHNLIRGTGLGGLGGIVPVQRCGEGIFIRPLLCISRKEVENYLRARGIVWMEDSSNQDCEYTRNKLRHEILPELEKINPRANVHIAQAAAQVWKAEEYLKKRTMETVETYTAQEGKARVIFHRVLREPEVLLERLIKEVLEQEAGEKRDISYTHIEAVKGLFLKQTGASVSLVHGLRARQVYGDVHIFKGEEEQEPLLELEFQLFPYENQQIPEKTYTKWFDYDKIKNSLAVRRRLPGDYLTVTREGGRKKLKDYFIDCKVPRQKRENVTLLADGSHILWAVGYRISEHYKVTDQTKRVIKVQVKGENNHE